MIATTTLIFWLSYRLNSYLTIEIIFINITQFVHNFFLVDLHKVNLYEIFFLSLMQRSAFWVFVKHVINNDEVMINEFKLFIMTLKTLIESRCINDIIDLKMTESSLILNRCARVFEMFRKIARFCFDFRFRFCTLLYASK